MSAARTTVLRERVAKMLATPTGVLLAIWLSRPQVIQEKLSRRVRSRPSNPCRPRNSPTRFCFTSNSLVMAGKGIEAAAGVKWMEMT